MISQKSIVYKSTVCFKNKWGDAETENVEHSHLGLRTTNTICFLTEAQQWLTVEATAA